MIRTVMGGFMPCKRLLLIAISVLVCAGLASAQARQSNGAEVEQFRLSPYPQDDFTLTSNSKGDPTTRVHVDPHVDWGGKQPSDSDVRRFPADPESSNDATCFSIRSFRVVRDNPDSDAIHHDGTTTCVPSARFRVHTVTVHEP
jgi:hypothetical protein